MTAMMAGPTLPMRVDDRSRSSDCPVLRGGANVESPPTSPRSRSGAFRRPWPSASARDVSTRDASTLFDALKGGVESAPASPTSSRSGAFRRPRQALARLASRGRHSQVSTVSTLRFFDASSPRLEATPAPQERDWTVKIEAWSLPSVRGKGPPLPPNGAQVAQIFQRHWEQIRAARPTERCATAPRSPMEKGSVGQPKIRPKVSPKRERRLPELTFFEKPPEREETDFPRPSETFARLLSNEETANSSPRSEGLEAPVSVQRAISRTRTLTLSRAISEETEGEELSLSGTREDSKATHRSEEVIPKAPLPFTEEKAAEVFAKLSEYEELHESELSRAMQLLGYMNPNEDWIRTIFRELVPTYNTIQMTEFSSFVKSYAAKHHEACSEAFARYEVNGLMDGPALQKAVQPLGIELLPYVAQEILEEVKQGKPLELSDFEAALPLILQREGFSTKEYEEFQLLFTMNDRDGSGDVDVGELKVMIHWLGFSASHLAPELARKVDRDGSGSLNFVEFLACMRLLRTIELETVQKLMQAAGARDGGDRLEVSHLPSLLNSMGYETWDLQVIEETLEDATLAPCTELELGDVWRFLMEYRRREGFGRQELQEITETFRRHDEDESGELDNLESPLALRMLGFSVGYTEVQSWLLKVDVDESGALNLAELRKLVRMLQAQDMEHFRDVFDAYVRQGFSKGGPPGTLTRENCVRLLELLNFTVPLETFDTVHVTEHQFLTVCYKLIKAQRMECRKNGGWSAQQLKVLRAEYETYASSRDGCVANKDLIRLLEDVLPDMSRDPLFRPELRSILRQVKVDSTGRLGFKEYLTFLQLCRSAKEISVARRQQAAVEETGFSGPEVQELRELFLEAAAPSGITFDGLWKLINSTTPLGHALTTELQELFNEQLMRRTDVHEPPEQALDFADFLRFMRQMMEINFANLVNDPQN